MDPETEAGLVARLRAGEQDAFDAAYDEHHARLFTFLARLSRSRDVADDLVEETWLRLIAHAGRLRPDTRLGPWLFAVARNLFYSYCRSRAIDDASMTSLIGLWPMGLRQPSPFEQTASRELERRVEQALSQLPTPYREALLLVGVNGFTPTEAAAVCGLRAEAFRQRLSRARTMLDRKLETTAANPAGQLGEVTT